MSVFSPMAAMAMRMKKRLRERKGVKSSGGAPRPEAMVVMTQAPKNARTKNGKLRPGRVFAWVFPGFPDCETARNRVMGMMASVRVSFTVTAFSSVALPR